MPLDDIDDETIVMAAELAAAHSTRPPCRKTPVDYTQRKNLKKPPSARPGKVIYDDYFTVYVMPIRVPLQTCGGKLMDIRDEIYDLFTEGIDRNEN